MKTGWILQAENGKFVDDTGDEVSQIKYARVFATRKQARKCDDYYMTKLNTDVVRKVQINKKYTAIKIIKGR